jgi:phosphoglycerate dehydrogenase-like enzyme
VNVRRHAVIDLGSTRPVWSIPESVIHAVGRAFGRAWEVVAIGTPASSDGDGGSGSEEAIVAARGAEVYIGWGVPPGVLDAAASTLRWAHSGAAGVGGTITPAFRATGAQLTNSRGIHADPIADWVLTAIGFCLRGLHAAVEAQRERRWAKGAFTDGRVPVREFAGTSVGVVGLGGIGRAVAKRCAALGMTVRGVRRRPGAARPGGVSWVGGPKHLVSLARRSEVLVIAAPRTGETRHLVDAAVLDALPQGAFLINVARGDLVDNAALLAALDSGHVAGCALDVLPQEPLPPDDRLWTHPRVLVSPHVSAVSDRFWQREGDLLVDNVRRYRQGRRLRNLVNLDLGY